MGGHRDPRLDTPQDQTGHDHAGTKADIRPNINNQLVACLLMTTGCSVLESHAADSTTCFSKPATIASGQSEVAGSGSSDVIVSGPAPTFVYGYSGNDRICARDAADEIWGGPGTTSSPPDPERTSSTGETACRCFRPETTSSSAAPETTR